MKRVAALLLTAAALMGGTGGAGAAPPTRVDLTDTVPAELSCVDFGITVHVTGKEKAIEKGGSIKYISPGLKAEVFRTDDPSVRKRYVITGSVVENPTGEFTVDVRLRGRNLLAGLVNGEPRVVVTAGNFRFDGEFLPQEGLFLHNNLRGNGRLIDVCSDLR